MNIQGAQGKSRPVGNRQHSFGNLLSRYDISSFSLHKFRSCLSQDFADCELYQACQDSWRKSESCIRTGKSPGSEKSRRFSTICFVMNVSTNERVASDICHTRSNKLIQH